MKRLGPFLGTLAPVLRQYSQKPNDAVLLADALGLLSPQRTAKAPPKYKPLIFTNLHKGSVAEHYHEIKKDLLTDFKIPDVDHLRQIDGLLSGLRAVGELSQKRVLQKNLYKHVNTLQSEDELVELVELSFYQNRLTLPLLTRFMLNRNLTQLSRLPFDVQNPDKTVLARNGWTDLNYVEFKVLLMKKYHDLGKPLLIVKLLKENFETEFYPLVRKSQLTPFYERILWKFYFDFISLNEAAYVKSLDNLRSSFMILESSSTKSSEIAQAILAHHDLSPLQALYLELYSIPAIEAAVTSQLLAGKSPLLSSLKKLSVKFKIYEVKTMVSDSVANRALGYSLIHSLENLIKDHFANWQQDDQLNGVMSQLRHLRTEMVHQGIPQPESAGVAVYTN